jgi:hypothetical protein
MKVRYRWAIQQCSYSGHPDDRGKWSGPLGAGWIDYEAQLPAWVDHWPASFRTRREAREAARQMRKRSQRHSDWRFRPVKIAIRVTVI